MKGIMTTQQISLDVPNLTLAVVGPFSQGKSTMVYYLTNGTKTQRSSKEKKEILQWMQVMVTVLSIRIHQKSLLFVIIQQVKN